jgi:ABC-2 type transport system ATP-binding protein
MSIKVERLSKSYGNQTVLDSISFETKGSQIVGLLGPNGAGKSTLMKTLTTYQSVSSGTVFVNGYDVSSQPEDVQNSIGYLPEHNPLYTDMYVREYLAFINSIFKGSKSRIDDVIAMTSLAAEAHKKIAQLSKGYRQRVGLAAALIHDPKVLILDEPTTGLDPNQLLEIRSLIKSLGNSKTILISSHILQEIEAICDRVIIINKGKIVADKILNDLRKNQNQSIVVEFDYRVEEAFLNQLPNISKIINTQGFIYELTFETSSDMRSIVFDFAQEHQLKILQLNPKNQSLETLFKNLTSI